MKINWRKLPVVSTVYEHFCYMDRSTRWFAGVLLSMGAIMFIGLLMQPPAPPYDAIGKEFIEQQLSLQTGMIRNGYRGEYDESTDTTSVIKYSLRTYGNGYFRAYLHFSKCNPDSAWKVVDYELYED